MMNDALHVVLPRAAGFDVHKMEIAATVLLCGWAWRAGLRDEELQRIAAGP